MRWDRGAWDRHLRIARSALGKRDVLARPAAGQDRPERQAEDLRERKAWAAKARANLKRLSHLARQAPDRRRAEAMVRELIEWYERPGR